MKRLITIQFTDPKFSMMDHAVRDMATVGEIKRCVDRLVGVGRWSRVYVAGTGSYMTPQLDMVNIWDNKEAAE